MLVDDEEFYNMQKPFPLSDAHPCHTPTQTYRTGAARTRRGAAAVQRPEHTVIRGRPARCVVAKRSAAHCDLRRLLTH